MPRPHFIDPAFITVEIIYTLVVTIFCLLIYFKTKEMYSLTKHKGISYFRNTFLFLSLAYIFRLALFFFPLSAMVFDFRVPRYFIGPLSIVIVTYLSTMAIFSLSISTIWKKVNLDFLNHLVPIIAALVSLLVFMTRSQIILIFSQVLLLIFSSVMAYINSRKSKKPSKIFLIYVLLFLFWIFNLFILEGGIRNPFEVKLIFYTLSLGIFILIFKKVKKWTK